jgi:acyl carrier protein
MDTAQGGAAGPGMIQGNVIEILEEMTRDWDTGFSGKIGPDTQLMKDLTFESIDIVMLIVAIEEKFGKKGLPFDTLLMVDGRYVEDLKVSEITGFLANNLGTGAVA